MSAKKTIIGIVAPSRAITEDVADCVKGLAHKTRIAGGVELRFHRQCFASHGHFAGDDETRSAAFVEYANDPVIDAIWFARGGYGACRFGDDAYCRLNEHARAKTYLGYSDTGAVLARLYALGFENIAHGPMPCDIIRDRGETAIRRALTYLAGRAPETIDPNLHPDEKAIAFNITMLSHLIGAQWAPDLSGHVLCLEDVGEYHYQLDRALFTITSNPNVRSCAGIRLGRCSDIPQNDIDFGCDEVAIVNYWCKRNAIAYLGRCDIGHDIENKIIPFG